MHATRFARLAVAASLAIWLSLHSVAQAQVEIDFNKLGEAPDAEGPLTNAPVKVEAKFVTAEGNQPARLLVTAVIERKWHINSQAKIESNIPTRIDVPGGAGYKLTGAFTPNRPPVPHNESGFKSEQHEGTVTWTAPIELAAGVDPATLSIEGTFTYQACSTSCLPPATAPFSAKLGAVASANESLAGGKQIFRAEDSPVTLTGYVESRAVAPGSKFKLVLTAEMDPDWHIYPLAALHTNQFSKPTLIVLSQKGGFEAGSIKADVTPKNEPAATGGTDTYYEHRVSWTVEMSVPADAKPGVHALGGAIGYQTCKSTACKTAIVANFSVDVPVEASEATGKLPLVFQEAGKDYADLAKVASSGGFDEDKIKALASGSSQSLILMLGAALLGGLILNAMPCVLPVIGLKILGFVEQSHDHRSRVFMLNMWFSLGLISVFLVLASLAVFLGLSWGEQFTQQWFVIAMAGLVFVMALSFLGVWEIPIPGFVGSGGAQQLASREGMSGAFAKGVFTTILATPCSGPFLGPVFGLLLKESPIVVYAVFLCVGLGMASPYLLIGMFPQLLRFLPRPGAWMDTLKQFMAFVLLATVVYLFTVIHQEYFVPTFALLIGLWLGCWWIGRTPLTAELGTKLVGWGAGAIMATAVGWFSFTYLTPGKDLLDWKPYSRQTLVQLTSEGKTVFIDFTADWCPTCKFNEKVVINTNPVKELVDELDIVTLKADWTDHGIEIKQMLRLLGKDAIPVYAIFPADRPNEPIVLSDLVTQKQILESLRKAGKSQSIAADAKNLEKTVMRP